ncbi:MAG: hypothetical protein IKC32_07755 [Clostridia bacterium]|nr:hypothetical protein [Clostridia bacterium]
MKDCYCSLCRKGIEEEGAPILAISGAGIPRYLCEECAAEVELAAGSLDVEQIKASVSSISDKISAYGLEDGVTMKTVGDILSAATKRAKAIEDGNYDPDAECAEGEELEELPEELLESEEDKLLDEKEAEAAAKLDKVMNWVWAGVLIGVAAFMVWWLFF